MDDLHPYDGVARRFCDADEDPAARARGRGLVKSLLRLTALPAAGLRYDLLFDSGGAGVFDRLHVAMPCGADEAAAIAGRAGFLDVDAPWDADDRASLEWLVHDDDDEPARPLVVRVAAFVAAERREFQPAPGDGLRVWFSPGSDVNAWSLIYAVDGALGYIAQDQG